MLKKMVEQVGFAWGEGCGTRVVQQLQLAGLPGAVGLPGAEVDLTRLRQDGLPAYCFGDAKTPQALQRACTRFIDTAKLVRGQSRDSTTDSKTEKVDVDDELIQLLGDAWKASSRDDAGFARLHEVGQIAGNRSSFDVRNYGFKRLSELVGSLDRFEMKRGQDEQLYVRRLR